MLKRLSHGDVAPHASRMNRLVGERRSHGVEAAFVLGVVMRWLWCGAERPCDGGAEPSILAVHRGSAGLARPKTAAR
jgi:hypothetical protein